MTGNNQGRRTILRMAWKLMALLMTMFLACFMAACSVAGELLQDERFLEAVDETLTEILSEETGGDDAVQEETDYFQSVDPSEGAVSENEQADSREEAEDLVAPQDMPAYGKDYTETEDVAYYLHTYGELPPNFITKNEAQSMGWDSSKGNLWDVAPGKSIGGDRFGNYEGLLPKKKGRQYFECDVNYLGGYRGKERIIFSNDGLIYYTRDHYNSFTLLYGEE